MPELCYNCGWTDSHQSWCPGSRIEAKIGPTDRDWWTFEIDVIPGEKEIIGSVINRFNGEIREFRMSTEQGYRGTLAAILFRMYTSYEEVK